jgi:hypothetical protein
MAYKIYPTSKFSRAVAHFYKRTMGLMLQLKELGLARSLHGQKAWEELAEDPFRGLRAGPVTFSPFLFPHDELQRLAICKKPNNLKTALLNQRRSAFIEENSKALHHGAGQFSQNASSEQEVKKQASLAECG